MKYYDHAYFMNVERRVVSSHEEAIKLSSLGNLNKECVVGIQDRVERNLTSDEAPLGSPRDFD